mgnify:CR=1 FL=1
MDTEEGVEVVWNEVQFSERKNFKNQEEKIQLIFENLTQLEHPNIVKFHRYWTDTHNDKPRVRSVFFWVQFLQDAFFFRLEYIQYVAFCQEKYKSWSYK